MQRHKGLSLPSSIKHNTLEFIKADYFAYPCSAANLVLQVFVCLICKQELNNVRMVIPCSKMEWSVSILYYKDKDMNDIIIEL